jgi:hypothetical protein
MFFIVIRDYNEAGYSIMGTVFRVQDKRKGDRKMLYEAIQFPSSRKLTMDIWLKLGMIYNKVL